MKHDDNKPINAERLLYELLQSLIIEQNDLKKEIAKPYILLKAYDKRLLELKLLIDNYIKGDR